MLFVSFFFWSRYSKNGIVKVEQYDFAAIFGIYNISQDECAKKGEREGK